MIEETYLHNNDGVLSDVGLKATINSDLGTISISIDGFGDPADGCVDPVVRIEVLKGIPRVLIYGDVNSDEPTHIIPLEGARKMKLTWKQLKEHIDRMSDTEQKDDVTIFDHNIGEYFGVHHVEEADGNDVIDDGQKFLVMDNE